MVRASENAQVRRLWRLIPAIEGTIANAVLRDLDLNFQGHKFETLISRKR